MSSVINTHDQIAASLTSLYLLLIKLGYLTHSEVSWPPHADQEWRIDLYHKIGLDESAITLLSKIPWTTQYVHLVFDSYGVNYSHEGEMRLSRNPTNYILEPDINETAYISGIRDAGWMLPLTACDPVYGICLLLDSKDGTIRTLDGAGGDGPGEAENPSNYLHPAPRPAVEVLDEFYQKYKPLEAIPIQGMIITEHELFRGVDYDVVKGTMIEEYGWPEAFRTEDWRKDLGELYDRWTREKQELGRAEQEVMQGVSEL